MGDRRNELKKGYVLLDALFTLFLATVVLLSVLGVVSLIGMRAARVDRLVRDELQERTEYGRGREILFTSK
jgi:hypothetical protein